MKKNVRTIIAVALALVLSALCFAGCGQIQNTAGVELASGGVLCLKVNPEIAIAYDADGNVTGITARNAAAKKILEAYTGFEGKPAKTVVAELVEAIGQAGYFVEEIDGEVRHITIEIEPGSSLPEGTFLDDVVANVKNSVNSHSWQAPLDVLGEDIFGITDYVNTDYGAASDGITNYTDYNDPYTNYDVTDYGAIKPPAAEPAPADAPPADPTAPAAEPSAPAVGRYTDYGKTDYKATDYGKTDYNDPKTDYNKTDYNKTDYNKTDYNKTDYNDPKTDYNKTDYNKTDYDATDYR